MSTYNIYEDEWVCWQVGTTDGRVKVFGRDSVEVTFKSPCQCASRHLQFLDGKGALLRVTQVAASKPELHQFQEIVDAFNWSHKDFTYLLFKYPDLVA